MRRPSLVSGDGYVEMTVTETNKDRLFGLTHNETTASYTDLDFGIRPYDNATLYVFESGANRGSVGSYSAGDKLRVAIESGVVKYYRITGGTATLLYTSGVTPSYPLTADTSLYTSGATVSGAAISGNLSGTVFVSDSFTASDATQLGQHVGEIGATWAQPGYSQNSKDYIYSSRLTHETVGYQNIYYASGVPQVIVMPKPL